MKNYQYPEMTYQPTGRIVTVELFTIDELSDDARERAYEDWFQNAYESIAFELEIGVDSDVRSAIAPIITDWDSDSYGHIWPIMRNVEIPRDGHAPRMENSGDCFSMDVADAFNAHGHEMEEYAAMWYQVAFPEYGTPLYECDNQTSYDLLCLYEELYLKAFERAAQDALDKWEELRESEREYLTSREAFEDEFNQGYECRVIDNMGRVYYSDTRKWYTSDGEEYEQSDICHECVSIVKAR